MSAVRSSASATVGPQQLGQLDHWFGLLFGQCYRHTFIDQLDDWRPKQYGRICGFLAYSLN